LLLFLVSSTTPLFPGKVAVFNQLVENQDEYWELHIHEIDQGKF
jgi:hypothetical protein